MTSSGLTAEQLEEGDRWFNNLQLAGAAKTYLEADPTERPALRAHVEAKADWPTRYPDKYAEARELALLVPQFLDDPHPGQIAEIAFLEMKVDEHNRAHNTAIDHGTPPPETNGNRHTPATEPRSRIIGGGDFILSEPTDVQAVWGDDERVAWAAGEPLLIVGPSGVGKTTLGQQIVLAGLEMGHTDVIGLTVAPFGAKALYIAADRPRQAARSMRRMVHPDQAGQLNERLKVWKGPLPFNLTKEPERLALMAQEFDCGVVVIDSLKDIATPLSSDEVGGLVNTAIQHCVASGIEVLSLHHQRKQQQGAGKPRSLDDVYGSVWITAGAGSVILIWGEPGDSQVELTHLKQPVDDIGPLGLLHDHTIGHTTLEKGFDLFAYLSRRPHGATVTEVAQGWFNTATPKDNLVAKARRRVVAALNKGEVVELETAKFGGAGGSDGARYGLAAHTDACPK